MSDEYSGKIDTEQLVSQLSGALNQLRAEIDNAFNEDIKRELAPDNNVPSSIPIKTTELRDFTAPNVESIADALIQAEEELFGKRAEGDERLKQALRLTEFLLKIKEKELADAKPEREHMQASVAVLANALVKACHGKLSPGDMLNDFASVLSSTGAVFWNHKGSSYLTGAISVEEAALIFKKNFSGTDTGAYDPCVSVKDRHCLFYIKKPQMTDQSLTNVLLFLRHNKRAPFSLEEVKLGEVLSQVLFNSSEQSSSF